LFCCSPTDEPDTGDGRDAAPYDADTDDGSLEDADEADVERDLSRCGAGTEACGDCHGTPANAAPPPDLAGITEVEAMTVGTHDAHMLGSAMVEEGLTNPTPCDACHREPSAVLDRRHCDSPPPAEVIFRGVGSADGSYPIWDRSRGTCALVYCHGATLEGGRRTEPTWNDPTPMVCGDCHRRNYHGQTYCDCHEHVWADGEIRNPSLHINGVVDM